MAPLSLGKKKSKTGRRPWAPGRKIDRPPARPGMYFKTTPTRPARAEKRKGRPPTHWACVTKRPGGRPPGPVGGPVCETILGLYQLFYNQNAKRRRASAEWPQGKR